jgi:hypothetical protein
MPSSPAAPRSCLLRRTFKKPHGEAPYGLFDDCRCTVATPSNSANPEMVASERGNFCLVQNTIRIEGMATPQGGR